MVNSLVTPVELVGGMLTLCVEFICYPQSSSRNDLSFSSILETSFMGNGYISENRLFEGGFEATSGISAVIYYQAAMP